MEAIRAVSVCFYAIAASSQIRAILHAKEIMSHEDSTA